MVHAIIFFSIILAFSRVKYSSKPLIFCSIILLGLFSTLRYQFGNDYRSYMDSYYAIRKGFDIFENEFLFTFLNKTIPSYYLMIAITSIFFLWVIYKLINNNLRGVFAGIGILIFVINPYLFLMNLSAIRQCISMCIFIVATKYLLQRKLIKYMLMILVAAAFHTSALILIPIYFFINEKSMNRMQTILLIAGMLLLLIEGGLVSNFVEIGLNIFDNSDYIHHFSQDSSNSLRATILTGISFVYVAANLVNLKGYKLVCGKLYLIGLLFGMLAFHFSMFTRVQMYFDIFSIVALPAIFEYHIKNTQDKYARLTQVYLFPSAIMFVYLARYYTFFANPMWESFSTYHTIFEAIL